MLGFPARIAGRLPLFAQYIWGASTNVLAPSTYALQRFGPSYRFRPWVILDASQLEPIERLINGGTDEEILAFRTAQLTGGAGAAVVGSLLASACATVLTLPSLSEVHITVRATFTISLMLSLLAVYFTLVQQRGLMALSAHKLRLWLWNGRMRETTMTHGTTSEEIPTQTRPSLVKESSVTSSVILEAPLELLSIAITAFMAGLIAYLGLVTAANVQLGTGHSWGNTGVLVVFVVCTAFPLIMFGQALGQKDTEMARCSRDDGERTDQICSAGSTCTEKLAPEDNSLQM